MPQVRHGVPGPKKTGEAHKSFCHISKPRLPERSKLSRLRSHLLCQIDHADRTISKSPGLAPVHEGMRPLPRRVPPHTSCCHPGSDESPRRLFPLSAAGDDTMTFRPRLTI